LIISGNRNRNGKGEFRRGGDNAPGRGLETLYRESYFLTGLGLR